MKLCNVFQILSAICGNICILIYLRKKKFDNCLNGSKRQTFTCYKSCAHITVFTALRRRFHDNASSRFFSSVSEKRLRCLHCVSEKSFFAIKVFFIYPSSFSECADTCSSGARAYNQIKAILIMEPLKGEAEEAVIRAGIKASDQAVSFMSSIGE